MTTVPRTLFDIAALLSPPQFRRAVNEAEIRRLWDPVSLPDLLERHPRRAGAVTIRAVTTGDDTRIPRNDLEDLLQALVDSASLPRPETNVWLLVEGTWIEVDCVWRDARLIVEVDGGATHHTRHAFENDRAKDRRLVAAGWRVIRITWRQLSEEPAAVVRDIRASLGLGANLPRA